MKRGSARMLMLMLMIGGAFFWLLHTMRIRLRQTPLGTPCPGPGAVELPDGTFTFRLDPAAFRAEFPQLQSYRCRELIPGDGVCTGPPGPPLLLLAVKSHPASSARRATARRTWARPGVLGGYRVRAVFLLGVSPEPRHMALLEEESQEFGDVVLWDIGESHPNLSLKERCFLRWVGARCGQADFIFKAEAQGGAEMRRWGAWILLVGAALIWLLHTVRLKLRQTPQGTPCPGPSAVELPDGTFTFRLDPAAFRAEFPQLQSYRCRELIPGDGVCTGPPGPPLLLLAVKSHPASSARRATARRTWARPGVLGGYRVRAVFLLGVSPEPRHMVLLEEESQEFGDVVLWDIGESHPNLSLKERCFLRWVGARCGQADFIFKGDDDEFVNPPALVAYLRQTPNAAHVIHGNIQCHAVVFRGGKYRVSSALFPQDTYPDFPAGGGFLLPRATVPALATASERIPVFPLDDVYLGFLVLAAGLRYRHDDRFQVYGMKDELCLYGEAFVVHGVSLDRVEEVWRGLYEERRCNGMGPLPS